MRLGIRRLGAILGILYALGCSAPRPYVPGGTALRAPAPSSPLAKVKTGMTFSQVVEILGPPTSQSSQLTVHAFNPLAIGNQGQVTAFHYAKIGRVYFAGPDNRGQNAAVIGVDADPQ